MNLRCLILGHRYALVLTSGPFNYYRCGRCRWTNIGPAETERSTGMPGKTKTFPNSSNIAEISYDDEQAELEVAFKGGSRYRYKAVPAEVYDELCGAASVGRTFDRLVRRAAFEYEKLSPAPEPEPPA